LHRHHIHHKARGGRDFALNYKILCKHCHEGEHKR
jgi:5-methylcytosine-specific restriction endonuclease McrA